MCQPFELRLDGIAGINCLSMRDAIHPVEDRTPVVLQIFRRELKPTLSRGFHGHH